jgi:hypothetical protein
MRTYHRHHCHPATIQQNMYKHVNTRKTEKKKKNVSTGGRLGDAANGNGCGRRTGMMHRKNHKYQIWYTVVKPSRTAKKNHNNTRTHTQKKT